MSANGNQLLQNAEEHAEAFFKKAKKYIPTIARLLLVATFIDDGFRMWTHYGEQAHFFRRRYPEVIVHAIILINMVLQLAGSGMVMVRKHVEIAVGVLGFIVVFQTLLYSPLWGWNFFARNLALCGGLLLLLAEARSESKKDFAGIPSLGNEDKYKGYMQLVGRLLVILMFLTLIHNDMSPFKVLLTVINFGLLVCVAVGFKTKLASLVLCTILFLSNVFTNAFWSVPSWQVDYVKYDFFQTLSVVGGLLMIVNLGAGQLSVDEKKKEF